MASRRKSAKPTNKIRQLLAEDEDDDSSEEENNKTSSDIAAMVIPTKKAATTVSTPSRSHKILATTISTPSRPHGVLTNNPTASCFSACKQLTPDLKTNQSQEPYIAIPSDIYQDFEALKSVTKLDTPELMRKLLKDYHRLAASPTHLLRERRLDGVIVDLVAAKKVSALDLSKNSPKSAHYSNTYQNGDVVKTSPNLSVVDQCSLEEDELSDDDDETSEEVKPLDLTLHRQEQAVSPDSAIVEDIHSKSITTASVSKHECCTLGVLQSLPSPKHTGSYVINLEAASEANIQSNSMLAQALQLDLRPRQATKIQHYTIGSPTVLSAQKNIKQQLHVQNTKNLTTDCKVSEDIIDDPINAILPKGVDYQNILSTAKLDGLPSYSEALSSVLNTYSVSTRHTGSESVTETSKPLLDGGKSLPGFKNTSGFLFQTSLDEIEVNNSPMTLTSRSTQQGDAANQLLHQHLIQHHIKTEHLNDAFVSQLSTEQHQNKTPTGSHLSFSQLPSHQSPSLDMIGGNRDKQNLNGHELSYPNFLLEPQSIGIQPNPTTMTTGTVVSTASIPMPAFFMTTSSNCMSNVVAVLHSLPEGVTGLQPFAFAPHAVQEPPINTSTTSAHISNELVFKTANMLSEANFNNTLTTSTLTDSTSCTNTDTPSPPLTSARPKPGRPRGKGGRGKMQRIQNKDMKLLTENTLFPGVYTSILKLPWSRRSRNKSKTKTTLESKKDAQIIAHQKVNEDTSSFFSESGVEETRDLPVNEMKINSNLSPEKQVESNSLCENIFDNPQMFSDSSNDQKLDYIKSIQLQKQKDLEQQKRLHAQYHQRLQEEQRKLTKQIEMSYLNLSNSPLQTTFSVNNQTLSTIKQEVISPEFATPGFTGCDKNLISPDKVQVNQLFPSNDITLMTFSCDGQKSSTSRSPRKRGRPPKMPLLNKPLDVQSDNEGVLPIAYVPTHKIELEPDNFLNVSTASASEKFSILKSALSTTVSEGVVHRRFPDTFQGISEANPGSMEVDVKVNPRSEERLSFLASKLDNEIAGRGKETQDVSLVNISLEYEDDSSPDEQDSVLTSEITQDVKPRRKKVSRSLKSNEHFMYATFKIKPRNGGLTPRKSRRKRKDVLASTAAAAETIASLKQKKLHDMSTSDLVKPASMIAWKFHEQYPHSSEENCEKGSIEKRSADFNFVTTSDNSECITQLCEAFVDTPMASGQRSRVSQQVKAVELIDSEMKAECCVTCGQYFQKHYSDTSARCNECIRSRSSAIKSSKLFSFCEFPTLPTPSTSSTKCSPPANLINKETSESKPIINHNHLHCSICRKEFTKICDYLHHIRESHDTPAGSQVDTSRKLKVSKTKKSLAHKTLTCPVEDCPHFFREQRDLDSHFIKKHSSLGTCPHNECTFTCSTQEDLENHLRFDHETFGSSKAPLASSLPIVPDEDTTENLASRALAAPMFSEKPLQCDYCDYRCRQKNALTWHMRKHPEAASQYKRYNSMVTE